MLAVHNTINWPPEKFLPYGPAVTAAMKKLADRFPREVSIEHLAREIMIGKRQLWLILDGEKFVSFVLTEIQTNEANGLKTLVIPSFAGEEGASTVHLIGALEDYGRENGCDEAIIYGRPGWKRSVGEQGYKPDMMVYRKAL